MEISLKNKPTYVLELTNNEAKILKELVGSVGGQPETDIRRFCSSVYDGLSGLGEYPNMFTTCHISVNEYFSFKD